MLRLPARFAAVILCFAPLFRQLTWRHAQVLLIGVILVPGQRTVTSILRISGLCWERRFVNYHRVLNRAAWSGRAAARVLLGLLLDAFVPTGPVLLGLDDHIERRRGKRISAKGIYRDPVRSSRGHFVKASGLRWLSLMLLVPISWAGRVWALPSPRRPGPARRDLRHPPAARCRSLSAGPAAPAQDHGAAPYQGRAPADPGHGAGRSGHPVAAPHRA